ncbi:initiator tRNA phosphoribosyl transferase [Thelephora terrestris]|uniref:Initiator tRNA phosphoribosyl transferase n=1 Tax=Thelephora terrestris TaxID=56493 RepID=A0A9P6HIT1_9AGAM|nr:initiator tRNA phosphoribosyl transferase [Thelephora terrestris]
MIEIAHASHKNMSITLYDKKGLAEIRKESLDIYNRIHSIAEDALFVEQVAEQYDGYPIIPNLRCGAWYVSPGLGAGRFAYFKSTDGHFNNWSFNLRRPNVHLLPIIAGNPGIIIVDSTRAGKRMPDALSKTIPIWCAVMNKAIAKKFPSAIPHDWETNLFTPPASVSRQEHCQIEKRIEEWAEALAESEYELPLLAKPVRPIWVDQSTTVLPTFSGSQGFTPLICLSASKQIEDGLERREHGFTYVQGSGDDHELWGRGLNPDIFWSSRSTLLATARGDLESVIDGLIDRHASREGKLADPCWTSTLKPVHAISGRLLLAVASELPDSSPPPASATFKCVSRRLAFVLISSHTHGHTVEVDGDLPYHHTLRMSLPASVSAHSNFLLYNILPRAIPFIRKHLIAGENVCVACPTGKDVGPGVIVAALSLFFGDDGDPRYGGDTDNKGGTAWKASTSSRLKAFLGPKIDKATIRKRLQWIISSNPSVNPSRNTLKRVNEFLMSHLHHPHYASPSSASHLLVSNAQARGWTLNPASVQKISMRNCASIPSLYVEGTIRYSPPFIVTSGVTTPEIASE